MELLSHAPFNHLYIETSTHSSCLCLSQQMRFRTSHQLCPYQNQGCGPAWLRQCLLSAMDLELFEVTLQWSNVLTAHHKLNKVRPKLKYNHTSSEPYNRNFLARQFVLVQGIPSPISHFPNLTKGPTYIPINKLVDWKRSSNERITTSASRSSEWLPSYPRVRFMVGCIV